jgi:hypothetical protein
MIQCEKRTGTFESRMQPANVGQRGFVILNAVVRRPPLPDGSDLMTMTRRDILVLQPWRGANDPIPQNQPNIKQPEGKTNQADRTE